MDKLTRDFFSSILNDGGSPVYSNAAKVKVRNKSKTDQPTPPVSPSTDKVKLAEPSTSSETQPRV